jgi:hypothetical protein
MVVLQMRARDLGEFIGPRAGKEKRESMMNRWMAARNRTVLSTTLRTDSHRMHYLPPALLCRPVSGEMAILGGEDSHTPNRAKTVHNLSSQTGSCSGYTCPPISAPVCGSWTGYRCKALPKLFTKRNRGRLEIEATVVGTFDEAVSIVPEYGWVAGSAASLWASLIDCSYKKDTCIPDLAGAATGGLARNPRAIRALVPLIILEDACGATGSQLSASEDLARFLCYLTDCARRKLAEPSEGTNNGGQPSAFISSMTGLWVWRRSSSLS